MTDAFDADVLIYAATPSHPLGGAVRRLVGQTPSGARAGVGSTLLVPELLTKPHRLGATDELTALTALLARLVLVPCDEALARVAVVLGARFALRPMDAVHLATAVSVGASRFVTGNRRDFPRSIDVVEITYPEDLPR